MRHVDTGPGGQVLVVFGHVRLGPATRDGSKIDGSDIGLKKDESMTVRNLLYCALVGSGNDAAYTLAVNYPGGVSAFVQKMNEKAAEIHLTNTHFTNPVGWDEDGHLSTARDLASLAMVALKQPLISQIVATPQVILTDTTGTIVHNIKNTNLFIICRKGNTMKNPDLSRRRFLASSFVEKVI